MRNLFHLLTACLLAAFLVPAMAQTAPQPPACWPEQVRGGTGTLATFEMLNAGPVACWQCPGRSGFVVIAGNVDLALRQIGDRLDTIKAASSPADAAAASWRRHVRYDISTAPEFARMRDELRSKNLCGFRAAIVSATTQ